MSKCYKEFRTRFDPKGRRRFSRDYHYSFSLLDDGPQKATPVLIGGDPENFLWAVPFRKLKGQPLVTELMEVAPAKARKPAGQVPENSHEGIEIVHVIHGTIEVHIEGGTEGGYNRKLRGGDSIHFNSAYAHQIKNFKNSTSALLFLVRMPAR